MSEPILHTLDDGTVVHAYGCECSRCRRIAAAITAVSADGEYFFDDDELMRMFGGDDV